MANQCSKCGGGIDAGYTAPEALCICFKKDQKKIDNAKHEMLIWESRWLVACGWSPVDIIDSKNKGFVWKDEKGQAPFTHAVAVETQRQRDANHLAQEQFNLEVRHMSTYSRRELKLQKGQDTGPEDGELHTIIQLMKRTQQGDMPPVKADKSARVPPHA